MSAVTFPAWAERHIIERHDITAARPDAFAGRVLVVDDSRDLLLLHTRLLSKVGLTVTIAENGREAVDLVTLTQNVGYEFDLVLTDLEMPVLDGLTATRQMRAAGFRGIIIAVSACSDTDIDQVCAKAGCDGFVPKPLTRMQLVPLLKQCLPAAALERLAG